MEINPKFKNKDTIYYISLEEKEHDCLVCSGENRIKRFFQKCNHCGGSGIVKIKKWIIKYHFDHALINEIIIDLKHDNELQYLLEGSYLCLWEVNMFGSVQDACIECDKRNEQLN